MSETYYFPADKLEIFCEGSELWLRLDGRQQLLAPPRRALPLSDPDHFIMLSDADGNELGMIRDVNELQSASQEVLKDVLARLYVLTEITRVLEVDREPLTGQTRWRVEIAIDENTTAQDEENTEIPDAGAIETTAAALPASQLNGTINQKSEIAPSENTAGNASDITANDSSESADATDTDGEEATKLQRVGRFLGIGRDTERPGDISNQKAQEREFFINGQEDVQTARYPHIYIVDTDRNRYEIPNCEALDPDSRRAAERFF